MSVFARSQVTSGGLLLPASVNLRTAGVFNMNTPVHTVLIHLPTLCYGSRKQARVAVRLWRVSL